MKKKFLCLFVLVLSIIKPASLIAVPHPMLSEAEERPGSSTSSHSDQKSVLVL